MPALWSAAAAILALVGTDALLQAFPQLMPPLARTTWLEQRLLVAWLVAREGMPLGEQTDELPGTLDVVAVGDSFTQGFGVDGTAAWPAVVAESLQVSVLNLGQSGTGPAQYNRALTRALEQHQPDLVLYGFFANDVVDLPVAGSVDIGAAGGARPSGPADPVGLARSWLQGHSSLYHVGRNWSGRWRGMDGLDRYQADGLNLWFAVPFWRQYAGSDSPAARDRWPLVRALLTEARALSEARGARIVYLFLPNKEEVYLPVLLPAIWDETLDHPRDLIAEVCTAEKLDCFDLTPALQERAAQREQLFFAQDAHLNERGHAVVGRAVAGYLGPVVHRRDPS